MRWRSAALAVAFALAVTAWVGWGNYAKLRPPVAAVVTADATTTVARVEYRVGGVQRLARIEFSDHDPLIAPLGAVWVRLDFTMQLQGAGTDPDSLRCTGFLVSGSYEWSDAYEPSSYGGDLAQRQCHTTGEDRPPQPGVARRLVMHWLVPQWAADAPRFYLRFSTPPRAIELRP
ncbi:MAG: hypothetical protein IPL41_12445 [Micropruina sp.]|nr:hypothetical protein [Micropruina sp.]